MSSSPPIRAALAAALAATATLALPGCSDEATAPQERHPPPFQPLVLSNAVPAVGTSGSRLSLVASVVYVSMPSGSVPDGESAVITNPARGAEVTTSMVVGGFDPVPIAAEAGDSLVVAVQRAGTGGVELFSAKAPPRRAPVIVRTDPPRGRRDVPLNIRLLVVFSEPLDSATLRPSSMRLTRGFDVVQARVAFTDSTRVAVAVTPETPLEAGANYELQISDALADTEGETLGEPVVLAFVTAPAGGATRDCCTAIDAVFERAEPSVYTEYHSEFILRADSTFTMHFYDPTGQWPEFGSDGWYRLADSTFTFQFFANAGHPLGPQGGEGVLRDGRLAVRFNAHALLDDFEPGDYLLRVAGGDTASRGTVRVSLSASGPDAPASVRGLVSGGSLRSIRYDVPVSDHPTLPRGTSELSLAPGRYTVALEPPENCAASVPVDVDVTAGSTTSATLQLTCTAWSTLWISYMIVGPNGPTLMRLVYVCDAGRQRCKDYWADPGGSISARVAAGSHVALFSAYPDCYSNLLESPVTVTAGGTVSMLITASCVASSDGQGTGAARLPSLHGP